MFQFFFFLTGHYSPIFKRRKTYTSFLFFVTTACTATTGAFQFPSLCADQRLDMGSGFASSTKVTVGLTCCPFTLKQDCVLSSGSLQSQLVKSHYFSAGLQNALTGFFCDM